MPNYDWLRQRLAGMPQVPMSPTQGMAQQQQQPQFQQQPQMQMPAQGMPMQREPQQTDPALAAMLGIEALSPQQEALKRKQATVDALRDMALGGGAKHWTGALAQGVAGYGARRGQKKLDPEYEKVGAERRTKMEQLGRDLFNR